MGIPHRPVVTGAATTGTEFSTGLSSYPCSPFTCPFQEVTADLLAQVKKRAPLIHTLTVSDRPGSAQVAFLNTLHPEGTREIGSPLAFREA